MVRSIQTCDCCGERFISVANSLRCGECRELSIDDKLYADSAAKISTQSQTPTTLNLATQFNGESDSLPHIFAPVSADQRSSQAADCGSSSTLSHHQTTASLTIDRGTDLSTTKGEVIDLIDLDDNDQSCDSHFGSEGGDEIHCTQAMVDSEYDGEEEYHGTSHQAFQHETSVSQTQPQSKDISVPSTDKAPAMPQRFDGDADICFICGKSITMLKDRVAHMKRCARKHDGSTRELAAEDEHESFHIPNDARKALQNNPYAQKDSKTWHGNAHKDLQRYQQSNDDHLSVTEAGRTKTMCDFVQMPVRNINNVLVAGARRLSKMESIKRKSNNVRGKRKRSWGNKSKKTCPDFKRISGTDFICDGFYYARETLTQNYFLTHFHSDHYGGITSSWNEGIIYCSLPTATLVNKQLGVNKKYIHPLPMMTPTVIESRGKTPVTVILLDANHCPGAVMFLFQVGNKHILHVGDFRWNHDIMCHQPYLKPFISQQKQLDELFLDTTYCDPKHALPTQDETIEAAIKTVECELNTAKEQGKNILHLFGAYTIGKERMYMSIAEHFGWKIYVETRRYRTLESLGWSGEKMAMFTCCSSESCLWVIPMGDLNMKRLPAYLEKTSAKPFSTHYDGIVGYSPTGWSLSSKPGRGLVNTRVAGNITIHSIPYSEHSSFPELVDCLKCLRPAKIIPTVAASKTQQQLQMLQKGLRETQTKLAF